ncbi:MAG: class I SAM-dependent methyltransferase [Acidobacteria bacterium]|nr:class I SAM-dependent methyltransferase [Acidobacteriota bacterium]
MNGDAARDLAAGFIERGDTQSWFDALYKHAGRNFDVIPWADREMNVHLRDWCEREGRPAPGERVVVVGCGLGDDAEAMAARGAVVDAFDLSPEAIAWASERFPNSPVRYQAANLFAFRGSYELVVESYTLQAMPLEMRARAIEAVANLAAPGGEVIVICRGRAETDPPGELPWPLAPSDIQRFAAHGLATIAFEDFDDPYEPGKRRFRYHGRRA